MTRYPDLNDKVVLLTGGANGIGAVTVRQFHEQGARIYFSDVDADAGAALASALGDKAVFRKVDLRREAQVRAWIRQVGKREKRIDALVNNAARDPRITLEAMTAADWNDLFAINLRAFFFTSQQAAPFMKKRGGAIINFSSITIHISPPDMSAYVATKGGILGFTRALARELGPHRIRVNTLSPGWIMTDRQLDQFVTPAIKKKLREVQCIPDLLQPEEIANVALFLASDASSAITGQEILADRGWAHG
jgi:NAD(P)-dependent dehydrogenase (short-subunit alcohol dehydrogenase family)